jgi:D-sedoheptulose 7-phosphate isomerase
VDRRLALRTIRHSFAGLLDLIPDALTNSEAAIADAASLIAGSLRRGNKVMFCGNGGSAADAQHFTAELVGKFYLKRRALPALSLTTDTSILSSIGNDISFREVFSRQVEALARKDDVLVCISTSGRSPNVIAAAKAAKRIGAGVVALVGSDRRLLLPIADTVISVPSIDTPRVQEVHGLIGHILCQLIEAELS